MVDQRGGGGMSGRNFVIKGATRASPTKLGVPRTLCVRWALQSNDGGGVVRGRRPWRTRRSACTLSWRVSPVGPHPLLHALVLTPPPASWGRLASRFILLAEPSS